MTVKNKIKKKSVKQKLNEGGLFVGPSHAQSGIKFKVESTGETVEVEGEGKGEPNEHKLGEFLVCNNAMNDTEEKVYKGKPAEILDEMNSEHGCNGLNEKADKIKGGESVINRRSTSMESEFECEGTPEGIASAINQLDGRGVNFSSKGKCKLVKKSLQDKALVKDGVIVADGAGKMATGGKTKKTPNKLYHFTGFNSLKKILSHKKLKIGDNKTVNFTSNPTTTLYYVPEDVRLDMSKEFFQYASLFPVQYVKSEEDVTDPIRQEPGWSMEKEWRTTKEVPLKYVEQILIQQSRWDSLSLNEQKKLLKGLDDNNLSYKFITIENASKYFVDSIGIEDAEMPADKQLKESRMETGGKTGTNINAVFKPVDCKHQIFAVISDNTNNLSRIFVRIGEHYDGDKFKDQIFTLDEFKNYWTGKRGEFDYYDYWFGFNVPDHSIKSFVTGKFDPLLPEEKWLVDNIKSKVDTSKPYYIVGYAKGSDHVRRHELAHALYYLSPKYKKAVDAVIDSIPDKELKTLTEFLNARHYHKSVYKDEMQAYLLADKKFLQEQNGWRDSYEKYRKKLNDIFDDSDIPDVKVLDKMEDGGNILDDLPSLRMMDNFYEGKAWEIVKDNFPKDVDRLVLSHMDKDDSETIISYMFTSKDKKPFTGFDSSLAFVNFDFNTHEVQLREYQTGLIRKYSFKDLKMKDGGITEWENMPRLIMDDKFYERKALEIVNKTFPENKFREIHYNNLGPSYRYGFTTLPEKSSRLIPSQYIDFDDAIEIRKHDKVEVLIDFRKNKIIVTIPTYSRQGSRLAYNVASYDFEDFKMKNGGPVDWENMDQIDIGPQYVIRYKNYYYEQDVEDNYPIFVLDRKNARLFSDRQLAEKHLHELKFEPHETKIYVPEKNIIVEITKEPVVTGIVGPIDMGFKSGLKNGGPADWENMPKIELPEYAIQIVNWKDLREQFGYEPTPDHRTWIDIMQELRRNAIKDRLPDHIDIPINESGISKAKFTLINRSVDTIVYEYNGTIGALKDGGKTEKVKLNSDGGYEYTDAKDKKIAKTCGLVTLPKKIKGTNCGNCIFFKDNFCDNKALLLPVTSRQCCAYWDDKSVISIISNLPKADFFPDKKKSTAKLNDRGGYDYSGKELEKARKADLVTLPENIDGTTCAVGNCMYGKKENGILKCIHPKILLPVTERMSCGWYDNKDIIRPWGKAVENKFEDGGKMVYGGLVKGFNDKSFSIASQMRMNKFTPQHIWEKTMWYFNEKDGKWRNEISDEGYEWKTDIGTIFKYYEKKRPILLEKLIKHDLLFKMMPELSKYFVIFKQYKNDGNYGEYDQSKTITLYLNFSYYKEHGKEFITPVEHFNKEQILLTEIQSVAQRRFRFAKDIGIEEANKRINQRIDSQRLQLGIALNKNDLLSAKSIERTIQWFAENFDDLVFEEYITQLGEIEARDVAERINLTSEQRQKTFPLSYSQVPDQDIKVSMRDGGSIESNKSILNSKTEDDYGKQRKQFPHEDSSPLATLHEMQHISQNQRAHRRGPTKSYGSEQINRRLAQIWYQLEEISGLTDTNSVLTRQSLETAARYIQDNKKKLIEDEYLNNPAEIEAREVVTRFINKQKYFPVNLDGSLSEKKHGGAIKSKLKSKEKVIKYKNKEGKWIKRTLTEEDPEVIEARWKKKKERIYTLANDIQKLRNNVSRDLKSDDEKAFLTALIISIMDRTAERVGNSISESDGHFGVTGFKKIHALLKGNKVIFCYTGKSGVDHEKEINDERICKALRKAIRNSPNKFIFTKTDGIRIRANHVNDYLREFGVNAKDIRGYSANKWMMDGLKKIEVIEDNDKKRKRQFNKVLKLVAGKVGHGPATLRKHYLMPELIDGFINEGKILDIKEFKYQDGGTVKNKLKDGGDTEWDNMPNIEVNERVIKFTKKDFDQLTKPSMWRESKFDKRYDKNTNTYFIKQLVGSPEMHYTDMATGRFDGKWEPEKETLTIMGVQTEFNPLIKWLNKYKKMKDGGLIPKETDVRKIYEYFKNEGLSVTIADAVNKYTEFPVLLMVKIKNGIIANKSFEEIYGDVKNDAIFEDLPELDIRSDDEIEQMKLDIERQRRLEREHEEERRPGRHIIFRGKHYEVLAEVPDREYAERRAYDLGRRHGIETIVREISNGRWQVLGPIAFKHNFKQGGEIDWDKMPKIDLGANEIKFTKQDFDKLIKKSFFGTRFESSSYVENGVYTIELSESYRGHLGFELSDEEMEVGKWDSTTETLYITAGQENPLRKWLMKNKYIKLKNGGVIEKYKVKGEQNEFGTIEYYVQDSANNKFVGEGKYMKQKEAQKEADRLNRNYAAKILFEDLPEIELKDDEEIGTRRKTAQNLVDMKQGKAKNYRQRTLTDIASYLGISPKDLLKDGGKLDWENLPKLDTEIKGGDMVSTPEGRIGYLVHTISEGKSVVPVKGRVEFSRGESKEYPLNELLHAPGNPAKYKVQHWLSEKQIKKVEDAGYEFIPGDVQSGKLEAQHQLTGILGIRPADIIVGTGIIIRKKSEQKKDGGQTNSARTIAVGILSGEKVKQVEDSEYEFISGDLAEGSDEYWDLVGAVSGAKARQLLGRGITIRKKPVDKNNGSKISEIGINKNKTAISELDIKK